MASILQVEQIQGPTSGASANTITIPSGQTLDMSNATVSGALTEMPTDSIVGMKHRNWSNVVGSNNYSSSSGFTDITGTDITYTPKQVGNKIVIVWNMQGRIYAPSGQDAMCYFRSQVNSSDSKLWRYQSDNLGKLGDTVALAMSDMYVDEYTVANLNPLTFKMQTQATSFGSYFSQPHYANNQQHSSVYVMEIKQ